MTKKREPLILSSEIRLNAAEGDELPKKFSGVAYSGAAVTKYGGMVIDLATLRLAGETLPLLSHHALEKDVGLVSEIENSGSELKVGGELFSDIDPDAALMAKKSKRGAKYQMSVGVFDGNYEFIPAGKTATINGRSLSGPLEVVRDGLLREVSIAVLGADGDTSANFFSAEREKMEEIEKLKAQLSALTGELESEKKARKAAEDALAEHREKQLAADKAKRESEVKDLFKALGREFSAEAAAPYLAMEAAAFSAVSADLKKTKQGPRAELFSPTPTGGAALSAAGASGGSRLLADAQARAQR